MSSTCAVRLHHHVVGRAPASSSSSSSSSRRTTKTFPCAAATARVVVVRSSGGGSGGDVRGAVRLRRSEHRARVAVERVITVRADRGAVVCTATATAGAAPGSKGGENDGGDPTVGLSEWWTTFTKAPWDEGPKPWREFWAVKVRPDVYGHVRGRSFIFTRLHPPTPPFLENATRFIHQIVKKNVVRIEFHHLVTRVPFSFPQSV